MMWRPAQAVAFPATTGSVVSLGGPCLVMGWGFLETTGAAGAVLEIYDGQDTTGELVVPISLLASESVRDWNAGDGIYCSRGVFVRVVSGTVRGAVWVRLRHPGANVHEYESGAI